MKRIIMELARSGTTRVSWKAIIAAEVWLINTTNFRPAAPSFADMVSLMISTSGTSPQGSSSARARFGQAKADHDHPSEMRSMSLGSVTAFLVDLVVLHGQSAIQDITCALALALAVVKLALCSVGLRTPLPPPPVVDSAIECLRAGGFSDMCVTCMYSIHRLWQDVSPCSAMAQKWAQRRLLPTVPSDEDLAQMCAEMGRGESSFRHSIATRRGEAVAGTADVKAPTATLRGTGLAPEVWRGLKRKAPESRSLPRPGYAGGAAVSPTSGAEAELGADEPQNQEEKGRLVQTSLPKQSSHSVGGKQCREECGRLTMSARAQFCAHCFKKQAKISGARSAGNTKAGIKKKRAGQRSGIKRTATIALKVKKEWVDLILAKNKDWELRGSATKKRGWVHLAETGGGGTLVGRVRVVDCFPVPRSSLRKHYQRHRVSDLSQVPYNQTFAWVLADAERYQESLTYQHSRGAVIWCQV